MIENHPITPPPELWQQWYNDSPNDDELGLAEHIATQAARWGAEMELEACCEWLKVQETQSAKWFDIRHDACALVSDLCAARRPKPPSLKEQALKALDDISIASFEQDAANIIRRALEALPE